KGLGENEPDMMWLTTVCPNTRRLIKITPEAAEKTANMFDIMLGDDLQGRKDFISEFGSDYISQADIS
ncbi:MAG: DNA topoisomerase, partial [Oscillospiraceae bacterium]|nr:DNA topoisomerase [Oscillospiraceae bacterium]